MNTIDVLEKKKIDFRKIKNLADHQRETVLCDRIQEFLLLSDKREHIKNEIESEHKKYGYLFEKADKKERETAMTINREIAEVIESIMDVDKKIEQLVSEKKNSFLKEIKELKKVRTAVKGYGNKKAPAYPRFIKTVG